MGTKAPHKKKEGVATAGVALPTYNIEQNRHCVEQILLCDCVNLIWYMCDALSLSFYGSIL